MYGNKKLKDLKQGEYFTLKPIAFPSESQVYVRDEYDRSEKKYWIYKWSDVNAGRFMKGEKEVFTDFTF